MFAGILGGYGLCILRNVCGDAFHFVPALGWLSTIVDRLCNQTESDINNEVGNQAGSTRRIYERVILRAAKGLAL